MTVAEDEAIQEMIRGAPYEKGLLSELISKILAHPTFAGKSESHVFFDAYGRGPEGLRAYLAPKKSEDACVWAFCTERLKRFELEEAHKKEAENVQRFLATNPAT